MKAAMKAAIGVFLIVIIVFFVVVAKNVYKNRNISNFSPATVYSSQNETIRDMKTKQVDAVFMGNSITEHWSQRHPNFMPSNNYVNRGIAGETTPQMLLRFREDVVKLKPKVVVIQGGINDIAENTGKYDADFTLGNIKSMVEIAQANDIKVILASVLPATQIPWDSDIKDVKQKVADLNNNIQSYARENGIEYIDYFSAIVGDNGNLNPLYDIDGVHINAEGYSVLEPLIKAKIDALLE